MKNASRPSFLDRLTNAWPHLRAPLLGIAIFHATFHRYLFPITSSDIHYYFSMARTLLRYGRPAALVATETDISTFHAVPIIDWPAGYPVVLAAALRFLPVEPWLMPLILDWFFIAVCFVAWFVIIELIRLPVLARLLIWSVWALAFSPFRLGGPSDYQSMALFSVATALCTYIIARGRPAVGLASLAGGLVGFAAATRYAYWPLIVALPTAMLFVGWRHRQPLRRETIALGTFSSLGVAIVLIMNLRLTGHATLLDLPYVTSGIGFYPENLLKFHPFTASALGLDTAMSLFWGRELDKGFPRVALLGATALLLGFYARGIVQMVRRREPAEVPQVAAEFIHAAGALVVGTMFFMLTTKSLRYPLDGVGLTAVGIDRYWLPTVGFLAIALFSQGATAATSARRLTLLTAVVGIFGAMSALSFLRVSTDRILKVGAVRRDIQIDAMKDIGLSLQALKNRHPLVFADVSRRHFWGNGVAMANGIPVLSIDRKNPKFATSQPVTLVVGVPRRLDIKNFEKLAVLYEKYGAKWVGRFFAGSYELYVVDLPAGRYGE